MIKHLMVFVICAILFGSAVTNANGSDDRGGDAIKTLSEIRERWEDRTTDERETLAFLVIQLDARLAAWEQVTMQQSREIATLVQMISQRPYPADPRLRPRLVQSFLEHSGLRLETPTLTARHLHLALGLAGTTPNEKVLKRFLTSEDTPAAILVVALDALRQSGVPASLAPQIAALLEHPYRVLADSSDVGPPDERYVYPVRSAACRAIDKMGIPCKSTVIPAENGQGPPTESFEVDRQALEAFIQEHNRPGTESASD